MLKVTLKFTFIHNNFYEFLNICSNRAMTIKNSFRAWIFAEWSQSKKKVNGQSKKKKKQIRKTCFFILEFLQ